MIDKCCSAPIYDSNGMGCAPCGYPFPCSDHPGETPCVRCSYPRKLHDFRHDYPRNNRICESFTVDAVETTR